MDRSMTSAPRVSERSRCAACRFGFVLAGCMLAGPGCETLPVIRDAVEQAQTATQSSDDGQKHENAEAVLSVVARIMDSIEANRKSGADAGR